MTMENRGLAGNAEDGPSLILFHRGWLMDVQKSELSLRFEIAQTGRG